MNYDQFVFDLSALPANAPSAGEVSRTRLSSVYKPFEMKSFERLVRAQNVARLPNEEDLKWGDVVLCRPNPGITGAKSYVAGSVIANVLKDRGLDEFQASWTHAMLYVGDRHILESKPGPFVPNRKFPSGPQITPLDEIAIKSQLLVLRCVDQTFAKMDGRHRVTRYGLFSVHKNDRKYDKKRVFDIALDFKAAPNLKKSIICSEFVLEMFALNGILVPEYVDTCNGSFFFPGSFVDKGVFSPIPLSCSDYLRY